MRSREIGVRSFVIAGVLVPIVATTWQLMSGFRFDHWWVTVVAGVVGVAIGVGRSWVVLRRTALASSRIRLSVRVPLQVVWADIGHCGLPRRTSAGNSRSSRSC
jgi:hypothetical protein